MLINKENNKYKYYKVKEIKTTEKTEYSVFGYNNWFSMIFNDGDEYRLKHKSIESAEEHINGQVEQKIISEKFVFNKTVK